MDGLTVYHSFEEAEPDEAAPVEDGDDSLLADAPWANPGAFPLGAPPIPGTATELRETPPRALAEPARRVVPHPRDLRRGMRGFDVMALQRAMWRYGIRHKLAATGQFGKALEEQVKTVQRRAHLQVDGVYGAETHKALAMYYDAYAIRLLNMVHVRTPAEKRLADLMTGAMVLYNRRGVVHYSQGPARMQIVRQHLTLAKLGTVPSLYEDCSSSTTGLYYVAGLADPNALGYNGFGFTGTQVVHGAEHKASTAPKGALVFYGRRYPYTHVTMMVGGGMVFSHGSEHGPLLSRWDYRGDVARCRVYGGLPK